MEVSTKLNSIDPRNKTPEDYAKVIEDLGNQLKMVFINERMPAENAEKLAANTTARAILSKTTQDI